MIEELYVAIIAEAEKACPLPIVGGREVFISIGLDARSIVVNTKIIKTGRKIDMQYLKEVIDFILLFSQEIVSGYEKVGTNTFRIWIQLPRSVNKLNTMAKNRTA